MSNLFNVNTVFFTIIGYPMSYLEFFGTVFNLWCVWLVARNNILTWPVGIIGVILFGILFYQIQLYSDFLEQIYYLITSFYGWWLWKTYRGNKANNTAELKVSINTKQWNIGYLLIILLGSLILGFLMTRIHLLLPQYFYEPASYPYLDAFTTIMSFVAQFLLTKKKIEAWYLWILVDIIGIWLYFVKGAVFISLLYFIFLILATKGLFNWKKMYFSYKAKAVSSI